MGAIAGPNFLITFIVILSGPTELVPLAFLIISKVCSIVIFSSCHLLQFLKIFYPIYQLVTMEMNHMKTVVKHPQGVTMSFHDVEYQVEKSGGEGKKCGKEMNRNT